MQFNSPITALVFSLKSNNDIRYTLVYLIDNGEYEARGGRVMLESLGRESPNQHSVDINDNCLLVIVTHQTDGYLMLP